VKYPLRVYEMIRDKDPSGLSGTGAVGQVVEFENGWCAVGFYKETAGVPNLICYGSLADVEKIHGHGGLTHVELVARVPA
jgi:hypothetical protein